ncbi:Uncharacterised protein [Chlamydia trachomatis]|nr:Uncharacterised protein [Chlamydia trachomatis]
MVDEFSDVFLDPICQYFIEYFCINLHEGFWSVVLFLPSKGEKYVQQNKRRKLSQPKESHANESTRSLHYTK